MPGPGQRLSWAIQMAWGLTAGSVEAAACLAARRRRTNETAQGEGKEQVSTASKEGRLVARPKSHSQPAPVGLQRLRLGYPCDGLLYVPAGYQAERPAPFVLMLHGATSVGLFALWPMITFADADGFIVLAPDSRRRTWDRVYGSFGPDVQFIDRALERVFSRYAVDPAHLAIGGFSDGASYALSLGLANGDLFTNVIAFSPGFVASAKEVGRPRSFISHGTHDRILPVTCSTRIVTVLRNSGYDVEYLEFPGGHVVPVDVARRAVNWFLR